MTVELDIDESRARKQKVGTTLAVMIVSAWFGASAIWSIAKVRVIGHEEFPRAITLRSYGEFMTFISPFLVVWLGWDIRNRVSNWGKAGIALLFASTWLSIFCEYEPINLATRYVLSFAIHALLLFAGFSGVVEASRWLRSDPIV
jgi:hypothetical protein